MTNITFEQIPKVVMEIHQMMSQLLDNSRPQQIESDQIFTISEAAEFTHLAVPTIYGLVHRGEIPVNKKGKRLYFSKNELVAWIKSGRKKTNHEIISEAVVSIGNIKKKRR
jgi:excisionase family DNA binding protein